VFCCVSPLDLVGPSPASPLNGSLPAVSRATALQRLSPYQAMECFVFLLIIGAYVFALLYLNAKVLPGQNKLPERLKPVKYTVNAVGVTFLALFLMVIGVLLLVLIYCLLTDCTRIE